MFQTLQRVNAALARVEPTLPSTATVTANRLTFAAFPIMGYSLTSDTVPQTRLWELATYDLKPRMNRAGGVSTVVVQGGQEPEFEVSPDPSKLLKASVTVPDILDAIGRSNLIDSPGLIETNHQLVLSLVSGQAKTPAQIRDIVVKTTPAGTPVHIGDLASVAPSVKPVYTIVTANRKPAVLLYVYRQLSSNTVSVANSMHAEVEQIRQKSPAGRGTASVLRPVRNRKRFDQERARRHSHRTDSRLGHHGAVPAGLGHLARRRAGDSRHHRSHVYRPARSGRKLQPDDAGRPCRGGRPGD